MKINVPEIGSGDIISQGGIGCLHTTSKWPQSTHLSLTASVGLQFHWQARLPPLPPTTPICIERISTGLTIPICEIPCLSSSSRYTQYLTLVDTFNRCLCGFLLWDRIRAAARSHQLRA